MKQKLEGNKKKRFYSEIREGCENPVGLFMCDGPMETVFIKSCVPFES